MRVCYITPLNPFELSSCWECDTCLENLSWPSTTAASALIAPLIERGHQFCIITYHKDISKVVFARSNIGDLWIIPLRRKWWLLDFCRFERQYISSVLEEIKPDLIHVHWSYESACMASYNNYPKLLTCHDSPFRCAWESRSLFRLILAFFSLLQIRKYKNITVVSNYLKSSIQRYLFPRTSNLYIDVVPNILSFPYDINLSSTYKLTVGFVGDSGRLKNHHTLCKAINILNEQGIPIKLIIYGFDSEESPYNAHPSIKFMGRMERGDMLSHISSNVGIYVCSSRIETHSLSSLEAMYMKKPVICGLHSGGVDETIGYGKFGLLCDITNPYDIASKIIYVLNNQTVVETMVNSAFNHVCNIKGGDHTIESIDKIYKRIGS